MLSSGQGNGAVSTTYSYDAATKCAKVFNHHTGAVVCDVSGVDLRVGNLLSRLADEMYNIGYKAGREDAVANMRAHLDATQK
jgi:hypothetical protein